MICEGSKIIHTFSVPFPLDREVLFSVELKLYFNELLKHHTN